jgi:hypothetical protein
MTDEMEQRPASLLPYDQWADDAQRHVMLRALSHVVANGLPGEHHFYLTFRTDHPGTVIPDRMRAQYPQEMTIVLQHQFWDLKVDETAKIISVGLSFGGVATTLRIPFGATTQFVDPHVRYGLRFEPVLPPPADSAPAKPSTSLAAVPAVIPRPKEPEGKPAEEEAQVVSLDAFRRRPGPREG